MPTEDAMATVIAEPYRAYTPRPFTRGERDSVTILFGGLHWRAERILQAVLEQSGYRAQVLPVATKEDRLTGREVRWPRLPPADHARLSLGDLLHRPRAGPRIPGPSLRGRAREHRRRRQGEHRAPLRGLSPAAGARPLDLAGLAPDDPVLHEGAPGGPPPLRDDRGGSPAAQADREDHRRVLSPDRRGRAQLQHPSLAGGRRRRGVSGGRVGLDGLSAAARAPEIRGLREPRAERPDQARRWPRRAEALPRPRGPPAPRAGRSPARDAAAARAQATRRALLPQPPRRW